MEKKEFLNKEIPEIGPELKPEPSGFSVKLAEFSNKAFGVVKLILGLCLLPVAYSSTIAFFNEFKTIPKPLQNDFWAGIITLLIIYLFVWEPAVVYSKGHKILEVIFNFFKPLVRVAPYLLPIYTIVLFIAYSVLSAFIKDAWLIKYAFLFLGMSITLHLVFSAKTIRGKKSDFLKANYIFGFSFIYIVNIMLLAFIINLFLKEFSFVRFFNLSFSEAGNLFRALFKQLFL